MRSRLRFIFAISLAVVLAGVLGYMALAGNQMEYASPGTLVEGATYRLNGTVAPGAPPDPAARAQSAEGLRFSMRSKNDPSKTVEIVYRVIVPDQFKVGRDIIVTGKLENGVFQAKRGSMIAQCPSKFQAQGGQHPGTST
jgi:cytochrome c-type biogenesis protein CcmE